MDLGFVRYQRKRGKEMKKKLKNGLAHLSGKELLRELANPKANRFRVVEELLGREQKGEIVDIDDLINLLRLAPDECKTQILERVERRRGELRYQHWHTFVRCCGRRVKEWAENHRSCFSKKQEEDGVPSLEPAASVA